MMSPGRVENADAGQPRVLGTLTRHRPAARAGPIENGRKYVDEVMAFYKVQGRLKPVMLQEEPASLKANTVELTQILPVKPAPSS